MQTIKTDLELALERLLELKPNVTAADRKEAPASEATIVAYLNGQGKDLDTAIKLLRFFSGRIEERRELIGGAESKSTAA